MKAKVVVCLLGFLSFFAVTGRGQEYSKFDVFTGFSYARVNPSASPVLPSFNMYGGEASVAYNAKSWLSGVFDFGGYRTSRLIDSPLNFRGNMYTFLFGPRFSYRHLGRVTPFAQMLFGVAHTTSDTFLHGDFGRQTDFAMTEGGGLDFRLSHRVSVRLIQADYFLTHFKEFEPTEVLDRGSLQGNVRLSTGLVFHF
jgi:opacity protein-like surface antigen